MASSIDKRRYPRRLYAEGKSPIQKRSLNHYCNLSNFGMMKDCIGEELYNEIANESQVGVLLKLADGQFLWSAKIVHYLITNQLAIESSNEIWFLAEGSPLRFSLYEFSEITGMNCERSGVDVNSEVDHRELWAALEVDSSQGPNWVQLEAGLRKCRTWPRETRKMIALLFILHVGILGISRCSRIPLDYALKVFDEQAFESFHWGRIGFKSIVESIKVITVKDDGYTLQGCLHVLQIWAYESVKVLGSSFGNPIVGENVPLLMWKGGRPKKNIHDFIAGKKRINGKLEVKHLVAKPLEDIYPEWEDEKAVYGEGEGEKLKLDNLLADVINGSVDESEWVSDKSKGAVKKGEKRVAVKKGEKRKNEMVESEEDFVEAARVKKKIERSHMSGKKVKDGQTAEPNKETNVESIDGTRSVQGLVKLVEVFVGKMEGMDNRLSNTLGLIGSKFEGMVDKIGSLESDVKLLKKVVNKEIEDQESRSAMSDVGEEKDWIVKMKETSEEDFPIACVVRNPKAKSKRCMGRSIKIEPGEPKDRVKPVQRGKALDKFEPASKDVVDLSEVIKPSGKKKSTSIISDISDPIEKEVQSTFDDALDKLLKLARGDDYGTKKLHKVGILPCTPTETHRASILKRALHGKVLSQAVYDPFTQADIEKVDNFMGFIKKEMEYNVVPTSGEANFYLRMMTPKQLWPEGEFNYGWLSDAHMTAAMHMLRKRSMQTISPFVTDRIAFLDPWFVNQWAQDYKKYVSEKGWTFHQRYFDTYDGRAPKYGMTYKKWCDDVDILYLTHNIANSHWVALEVDLPRRRIKVFDSIIETPPDDEKVFESCKPYTKMIPLLIQAVAARDKKPKVGASAFSIYRIKTTPQNIQVGDCGVYALKYIECLALGLNFEGLCDASMPVIRLKLAAEVFDEVPDSDCFMQMLESTPTTCGDSDEVEFISESKG